MDRQILRKPWIAARVARNARGSAHNTLTAISPGSGVCRRSEIVRNSRDSGSGSLLAGSKTGMLLQNDNTTKATAIQTNTVNIENRDMPPSYQISGAVNQIHDRRLNCGYETVTIQPGGKNGGKCVRLFIAAPSGSTSDPHQSAANTAFFRPTARPNILSPVAQKKA